MLVKPKDMNDLKKILAMSNVNLIDVRTTCIGIFYLLHQIRVVGF